jgi:hypothetical protein
VCGGGGGAVAPADDATIPPTLDAASAASWAFVRGRPAFRAQSDLNQCSADILPFC